MMCKVEGCERPRRTRGLCNMHYQRWWKRGTTDEWIPPTTDYAGERYGKMIAIKPTNLRDSSRSVVWVFRCDCGEHETRALYSIRKSAERGCVPSCKNCKNGNLPYGVANRNATISSYKANAARRNLAFELNADALDRLFSANCYYCGAKPSNTKRKRGLNGDFVYQGIDRVNNNKGYTIGNCVPCCDKCNWAKKDMDINEFLEWVISVAERYCL